MKLNNSFFYTIRENVKDEESKSGNLLVRGGFIKKSGSGIYMFLPLGFKVFKNIEAIVREEMNNAEAQELVMPFLIPEEVYVSSKRRENFGNDMFSLKDRFERDYVLGPTHEELFTIAATMNVKSYKDLPFNLYQIANKYRDEPRPRYGLIRVREFVMKDAYSFDLDETGLDKSYNLMLETYKKIFDRVGINYKIVKADTGTMGGTLSEEFQAITDIGEDTICYCESCNYASNMEVTECILNESLNNELEKKYELVHTPDHATILDIASFLNIEEKNIVKTLIYKANDKFYACLVPGNRDVNELKLSKLLHVKDVELASFTDVEEITSSNVGFAGPIGIDIDIIIDEQILNMKNFVTGANKTDYHYKNVNITEFKYSIVADIKNVIEGDSCPKCKNTLKFTKGIEIGNIFKLGTKYSTTLGLEYLDKDNKLNPVVMGCYGIGLGRIMASIVEQKSDDKGIIWPINIAPYKVGIVLININDEHASALATNLYNELNSKNIDTLLDDRDERAGVKFNDMDLIGIPIKITIGKKAIDNIVEFKLRDSDIVNEININDVVNEMKKYL